LHNTGQTGGSAGADIEAPEAWDLTTGDSNTVVAIIDTGIDYTHEDLIDNVWVNPGEIAGNGVDDDGNGYIDDIHGIDTTNYDSDPMDDFGHGSHVAGTIGAAANNGVGVAGINWHVQLLACKFLNASGYGFDDGAIECLEYIKDLKENHGINVVASNNSWGGAGNTSSLYDAISAQGDILFVAAAGNDSTNNDSYEFYPSNYDLPNIIAVAATDQNDKKASFSNYGRRTVDIGAPGVDILSTTPGNNYELYSGTSMATPHVTGLAGLLKSQDPTRDWIAIKNLILSGGDDLLSMEDTTLSGKRLNAFGSLSCLDKPLFRVMEFPDILEIGSATTVSVMSINCEDPVGPVTMTLSGGEQFELFDYAGAGQPMYDGLYSTTWVPTRIGEKLTFTTPELTETIVVPEFKIATRGLVFGSYEKPYSDILAATGGLPPYTWSILTGSLPPDLTLDSTTGEISGTPTTPGDFVFTVQAQESFQTIKQKELNIHVSDFCENPIPLTNDPATDARPRWSPDMTRIVFHSRRTGNYDIWAMNADGSDLTQLTTGSEDDLNADWSPDGTKIVWEGGGVIQVMNADGSNPITLINFLMGGYSPKWSPDGTQIVFVSGWNGNWEIWVMNADGSDPLQLTSDPGVDFYPDWSPDGRRIAFTSNRAGSDDIWIMDADGSNPVQLTSDSGSDDRSPAWSPDGTQIAFASDRSGNPEIWVMHADGSNLMQLTFDPAQDNFFDWSPDGNSGVFQSLRSGNFDLWIYRFDPDADCIFNGEDNCPDIANFEQTDTDNDGTGNVCDFCPVDPDKVLPGSCGCGIPETDTDNDGIPDCNDLCETDPGKTEPGICGCGVAENDLDADSTPDCHDNCPVISNAGQIDADGDGIGDVCDSCPADPPVRVKDTQQSYFNTIQSVYDDPAKIQNGNTMLLQDQMYEEHLAFNRGIAITLKGGHGCDFNGSPFSFSAVRSMTIKNGALTVENIVIKSPSECVVGGSLDPCDDGDPCTVESCDPELGCVSAPLCDDDNACTDDSCDAELGCIFTPIGAACDDGNACTDDSCDPELGCVFTPNTAVCDDGDICTTGDICSGGVCLGSPVISCARPVPDTGQTTSYTDTFGEDHDYDINPPSYTLNGDGTTTDNVTGLIWQSSPNGMYYNWYKASGTPHATYNPGGAVDVCGNLSLAGYTDWRLPTDKELLSIVDYENAQPAIDQAFFPGTVFDFPYWTSMTYANDSIYAWAVFFRDGQVNINDKNGSFLPGYVRCVRGEQQNNNSFIDNSDGTVTDENTGLIWQKRESYWPMSWEEAITYCKNLELPAGQSDWRLPTIKELISITDKVKFNPAMDENFFPNTRDMSYWSSTTNANGFISDYPFDSAWAMRCFIGDATAPNKDGSRMEAKCVRGGE